MTVTVTRPWSYDHASARVTLNALNDAYSLSTSCVESVSVDVRGTFVGTLVLEGSVDGSTWTTLTAAIAQSSGVATTSSFTTVGQTQFFVGGYTSVRARVSAYTSGTLIVSIDKSDGFEIVQIAGSVTPAALVASTALIGDVGVQPRAVTGGFAAPARLVSAAASTNATVVKASAGRVYKINGYNASAAVKYLKLYNKATAPTVGTDAPVATFALKAADNFDIDLGSIGQYFATGIGYALTGAVADADTTALTAADVVGMNIWFA